MTDDPASTRAADRTRCAGYPGCRRPAGQRD